MHILNLVAEKTITSSEELKIMINRVKAIVTYFKQSVTAADQLHSAQSKDKQLKLIQSYKMEFHFLYAGKISFSF